MIFWYVYCIKNLVNGKQYIGITVKPKEREKNHLTDHSNGSKLVRQAVKKYGRENLEFEIIEILPEDEAKEMEILLISALKTKAPNGYNLTDGGEGTVGYIPSEETRRKQGEARRGTKRNAETRQRMRESHKGQTWWLGKKHTEETKKKIGDGNRGKVVSKESRKKMSESMQGRPANNRQPVMIDGVQYSSLTAAAKALGCCRHTLSKKYV